tara:strand:+ start:7794 stop:8429 length:636 start_codon:yes stop_codon:yes gene_type:complete
MTKEWTFETIAPTDGGAGRSGNPLGRWRRGLCDCFSNIGMCCCVLWCQPCTIGQVQSISRGGAAWACLLVTFGIIGFNLGGSIIQSAAQFDWANQVAQGRVPLPSDISTVLSAVSLLGVAASLCACLAVWNARANYRSRDNIPGSCFTDCLFAWCCSPCSVCQMFNQSGIVFAGGRGVEYKWFWNPYSEGVEEVGEVKRVKQVGGSVAMAV